MTHAPWICPHCRKQSTAIGVNDGAKSCLLCNAEVITYSAVIEPHPDEWWDWKQAQLKGLWAIHDWAEKKLGTP